MIMIIDLGIIYNSGSIFNTGCNRDKRKTIVICLIITTILLIR